NIVQNTLRLAQKKISMIEVCIKKSIGISINIRNNIVENIEFYSDGSLFITVYNKFSKGSVSSKDFTTNGINKIIDRAIHISKYSSSDFFTGLPDRKLLYHNKMNLDL
ncbi:MAG: DNA gyrase modulator, partial [Buchnera aphidicola]|nr:DNA gyrase modulator [Buchnera aphidicola]